MTKQEAADIFGGVHAELARALSMTRGGISQWPVLLTEVQADRVMGAAMRLGKPIPERFKRPASDAVRTPRHPDAEVAA